MDNWIVFNAASDFPLFTGIAMGVSWFFVGFLVLALLIGWAGKYGRGADIVIGAPGVFVLVFCWPIVLVVMASYHIYWFIGRKRNG
jgi:hypothetical protein